MILQLLVVITASPSVSCHKASLYLVKNWVISFKVSAFAGGIVRISDQGEDAVVPQFSTAPSPRVHRCPCHMSLAYTVNILCT